MVLTSLWHYNEISTQPDGGSTTHYFGRKPEVRHHLQIAAILLEVEEVRNCVFVVQRSYHTEKCFIMAMQAAKRANVSTSVSASVFCDEFT